MQNKPTYHIKSISEYHKVRGLPKPEHPLISVINCADIQHLEEISAYRWLLDFYSVSLKRTSYAKAIYGQQQYDFDEGLLCFSAPKQVFSFEIDKEITSEFSGWILLIHPDFLWHTPLANKITKYDFFGYAVHEALFLSKKEELTMQILVQNIQQEYHANMDKFSQNIIISQLETLLNYAERFYERQFLTRKITNHQTLERLETLLHHYFEDDELLSNNGIPTVQYVAEKLNVSPNYLSGLLKVITGKSTQEHIHEKLIEKAKEKLSTTNLSVTEIAYGLGFEHSQSFSRIFKSKTAQTPLAFRNSFN